MTVQLLIEDGSPDWWESPDIRVVPGTNPNGPTGTPVVGNSAYLWVTVRNVGDTDVSQVQVDFWVADPSLQIRKSTANHIGTAFGDVPAGSAQDVLCLVPWHVALVNGGHECVVVEASSPADPLTPPPADPDVLDAPTYPQIAQRNLSVAVMTGTARTEIIIGVNAGPRAEKTVEVEASEGRALSQRVLASLGLEGLAEAAQERVAFGLTDQPQCGEDPVEMRKALRVEVPRGTSAPAYLQLAAREPLERDEYAVVKVVERERDRVIGGLSIVVVRGDEREGGDQ